MFSVFDNNTVDYYIVYSPLCEVESPGVVKFSVNDVNIFCTLTLILVVILASNCRGCAQVRSVHDPTVKLASEVSPCLVS